MTRNKLRPDKHNARRKDDDVEMPPLPAPDERGHIPALEYARASIAQQLIKDRKKAGLSQEQLAKLARIRQETLSRIESGKHAPTIRTIQKIEKALSAHKKRK